VRKERTVEIGEPRRTREVRPSTEPVPEEIPMRWTEPRALSPPLPLVMLVSAVK
jgi:hypothetical protein